MHQSWCQTKYIKVLNIIRILYLKASSGEDSSHTINVLTITKTATTIMMIIYLLCFHHFSIVPYLTHLHCAICQLQYCSLFWISIIRNNLGNLASELMLVQKKVKYIKYSIFTKDSSYPEINWSLNGLVKNELVIWVEYKVIFVHIWISSMFTSSSLLSICIKYNFWV